jgi:predicted RND superfamily exporter protein
MTSLTTAGGLLSFAVAELAPIAEFGVFGPLGVMLALLLTLLLLPALIAFFPLRSAVAGRPGPNLSQRLLVRAGEFATDHASVIALSTAGLMAIAALGAAQLRFSHDPIAWFPEEHPLRVSTEVIDDSLKGSTFIEVLVEAGEENALHEPELLNRMDEMRRYASRIQIGDVFVGKTVSMLDVLKEIHQALNENRREFYAIPQQRPLVAQELLLFESSGSDDLEDLVDPQFSTARLTASSRWPGGPSTR